MIIKILLAGWVVLIVAIIANLVATRLGISTWYPFIDEVSRTSLIKAFSQTSIISKLFLFVIYPLVLGLSAYLVLKNIK